MTSRRMMCRVWFAMAVALTATITLAAPAATDSSVLAAAQPSALLTIDQNRPTVVDRIVSHWGDALVQSSAGVTPDQLRTILSGFTVAGGETNTASGVYATVAGGSSNTASGFYAIVAGGSSNTASGFYAIVAGGSSNTASGAGGFAAGSNATAEANGCFVWNDGSGGEITCGGPSAVQRVVMRANGRFIFFTDSGNGIGAQLAHGAGAWSAFSDRGFKEHALPVDGHRVLEQLASMPIATWNWKSQDPRIRHMGPMAQDFSATFGLGEDDRHISTVDADGVALAPIQGLHQMLLEKDRQITRLETKAAKVNVLERKLQAIEAKLGLR